MKTLKQCDARWGSKKLGNSNLCNIGCVCTCCAMLAQTTPDKIVDEASFTASGAIYWQTLKSLKFHWRGYKYENDKVLKAIKDYGGCLVEVNMPNAPGGKHWVLYTGNKKMNDPLTGKIESTSKYTPTGYCILEPIKQEENTDTMQIKKETFEKLVTKSDAYDKFVKMGYDKPEKIKEDIEDLTQDHKKCELAKSEMGDKIKDARKKIEDLEQALETEKRSKAQMVTRSDYNQVVDEKEALEEKLEELETKPTLEGKRKLLAGIVGGVLILTSVILDKAMGLDISPQELLIILAGPVSYVGAEGTADILRIVKGDNVLNRSEKTDE